MSRGHKQLVILICKGNGRASYHAKNVHEPRPPDADVSAWATTMGPARHPRQHVERNNTAHQREFHHVRLLSDREAVIGELNREQQDVGGRPLDWILLKGGKLAGLSQIAPYSANDPALEDSAKLSDADCSVR